MDVERLCGELCLSHKFIPDALYRLKSSVAEFFAKLADMHIDGSSADDDVAPPHAIENRVAREYLSGLRGQ